MRAYVIEQLEKLNLEHGLLNNLSEVKCEDLKPCIEPSYNIPPAKFFEPDEDGDTCLHLAIAGGYWRAAEWLVRCAPSTGRLGAADGARQTGLHLAVLAGCPQLARLLLAAGAPPDARDANGLSPLHVAVRAGDLACCSALLEPFTDAELAQLGVEDRGPRAAPDLEQWDRYGMTCLHVAVERDDADLVRALAGAGADVNAREGRAGLTPLHLALQGGRRAVLDFLLDGCPGLDPAVPSYGGLAAAQMPCQLAALAAPRLAGKAAAQRGHVLRVNTPGTT